MMTDLSGTKLILRVDAKRARDDESTTIHAGQTLPPLVRVRLDMLSLVSPLVRQASESGRDSEFVFRRLETVPDRGVSLPHGEPSHAVTVAKEDKEANTPHPLQVSRLVRGKDYVLIDCSSSPASASLPPDNSASAARRHHLYALERQTRIKVDDVTSESCALADDFGFDDFSFGTGPAEPTLPSEARTSRKRCAEAPDDAGAAAPLYYLAPSRRLETQSTTPFTASEASTRTGCWQFEAAELETASELFRAHDIFVAGEHEQDVQADLYMYPDHRKDDEYDSNAEDFSGNDYPDDADCGEYDGAGDEAESVHNRYPARTVRSAGDGGYGMFFEDDYVEPSLGKGWQSEDETVDDY